MEQVTTHEAKTHLSQLLTRVLAGEEFVICRGNQKIALLTAFDEKSKSRRKRPLVGEVVSRGISWTEDCFEPLTEDELAEWGL